VLFPTLTRLPRDWIEAARTMGATPAKAIATVIIPTVRPALLAAFILSFIYSLGSYVLPIMLGKPRHWTLSVHITDQALYQSNFPFAAALSVFLMVASLLLIALVYRLQKNFE
ncbi:MAG: ABC transporter permease subunit, partial [Gammaproteobacteria bacterium]|nr:ABC transporter permease subunit [Gammaproteobacteria bacterium]